MKLLRETTADWKVPTPNHTYIFHDSKSLKAIGYIKEGTKVAIAFSQSMLFDRRNRTFDVLTAAQARAFDLSAVKV